MQVIIPLAGKGTRLRPHTHLVPKPLLKVAGRPVMDWVMDTLEGLDVTELIFITGHLKEQVRFSPGSSSRKFRTAPPAPSTSRGRTCTSRC